MPLPARLRSFTSPLRCDCLRGCPKRPFPLRLQQEHLQSAVFVSCAESSYRPSPSLRSPFQWSHVVHQIQKPAVLSTSTTMATGSATSSGQMRTHMGHSHSHGHHHHHDKTLLTSKNKNDPGVRITRVGLYVNLGMAIAKGAGGYIFNSKA